MVTTTATAVCQGPLGADGAGTHAVAEFKRVLDRHEFAGAAVPAALGGALPPGFKIKLSDVLISSVAPAGAVGGGFPAVEQVSFSFANAEIAAADSSGNFVTRSLCGGSATEPPVLVDGGGKE
jgi:hypothetical protein